MIFVGYSACLLLFRHLLSSYNDTDFIEYKERNSNQKLSDDIWWRNDGGRNKNNNDGMSTIHFHKLRRDKSNFSQEVHKNGEFKNNSSGNGKHRHVIHEGGQGGRVQYFGTDRIRREERHGERRDDEIPEEHAHDK